MASPDFWNAKDTAQETVTEVSRLKGRIAPFRELESRLDDFEVLVEMAREGDKDSAGEVGSVTHFVLS